MHKNTQLKTQNHFRAQKIFKNYQNGIDIAFQKISYKVKIVKQRGKNFDLPWTRKYQQRTILKQITGIFKSGRVSAIMGASGAGKTTLLNILACRINPQKDGKLYANNLEYNYAQFGDFANYVMQNDILMQTLTVRETLQFATDLKINADKQSKLDMIDQLSKQLKLQNCLDTLVGGVIVKGVSGGQKKRTSIAFELITDPQVLFLDEPTSGLDSLTSFIIVNYMKKLTRKVNKTVIMTIHQPNTEIFQLFDGLLLLVEGKIIYQGDASQVNLYFDKYFGLKCPQHSNPPDFFMSKIHHESQINRKMYPLYMNTYQKIQKNQIEKIIIQKQSSQIKFRKTQVKKITIFKALAYRNIINTFRNPLLFRAKIFQGIFISLFSGGIFYHVGTKDLTQIYNWQMFTGFLFFTSINALTTSLSPVTITFPLQRPVFIKEQDSKMYSVWEYSISRFIMDIPQLTLIPLICVIIIYFMAYLSQTAGQFFFFLLTYILVHIAGSSIGILIGTLVQDVKSVAAFVPLVILPLVLFSGYFVNRDTLPAWIAWLQYLSPIKYGFICFVDNQVQGQPSRKWPSLFILLGLGIGYRVISIIFLWLLKSKSQ